MIDEVYLTISSGAQYLTKIVKTEAADVASIAAKTRRLWQPKAVQYRLLLHIASGFSQGDLTGYPTPCAEDIHQSSMLADKRNAILLLPLVKRIYCDGWETFVGNSGVIQYFGSRDRMSAEYSSALCGDTTVWSLFV